MNGWPAKPLEEIAKVYGGSTPSRRSSEYWGDAIPWVTPTDLPKPGAGISVVSETKERITRAGLDSCSATLLPPGAVLFSSRATIGKVAVADRELTTNQGFVNFVPNSDVDSRFLAYALWMHRDNIARLAGSTTFKEVSRTAFRKFTIPVPPLPEQKRVVKLLDEADELRKLRAKADCRTADLIPALFHEMFGDPAENPKAWPRRPLKQFGAEVRYGLGQPPELDAAGVPMLRATNIKGGLISEDGLIRVRREAVPKSRNPFLKAEDVLVVRSGAYTGDCALVGKKWAGAVAGYDLVISPNEQFAGEFVASFFLSEFVQEGYFGGLKIRAAQPHLNSNQVSETPIFCPPMALQRQFASRATEIRALEAEQAKSRRRLDDLFQSLLHRAFNGEL